MDRLHNTAVDSPNVNFDGVCRNRKQINSMHYDNFLRSFQDRNLDISLTWSMNSQELRISPRLALASLKVANTSSNLDIAEDIN